MTGAVLRADVRTRFVAAGVAVTLGTLAAGAFGASGAPMAIAALAAAALFALALTGARPAATLLVYIGMALMAMSLYRIGPHAFTGNYNARILTFSDTFLLAAALLSLPLPVRRRVAWRQAAPIAGAVALMATGGLLGTLSSSDPSGSAVNVLQLAMAALGLQLLVLLWAPDVDELRWASGLFVASVIVAGIVGLFGPEYVAGRVRGWAYHPNHLGAMTAIAAGPAIAIWLTASGWRRHASVAALVLLALVMLIAGSRTGLVASAAVVMVFALPLRRGLWVTPRTVVAALAAFAILTAAVIGAGFSDDPLSRRFHSADELGRGADAVSRMIRPQGELVSDSTRIVLLRGVRDEIRESPLTGNGFAEVQAAHNIYLQMWAAGGLLSLLGMLMVPLVAGRWALAADRLLSVDGGDRASMLLLGLAAGMVGYSVSGLFEPTLWERWIWICPALASALLARLRSSAEAEA